MHLLFGWSTFASGATKRWTNMWSQWTLIIVSAIRI